MVEYNMEHISDNELIEAANVIFTAQEEDFERIKKEKWYKTLFHAITLNNDGKKYAVKGIKSLAKLQQLFMTIYVKNYRESHEQLNEVIDAVKSNSEVIRKLYGSCVLNLEEQASLTSLSSHDAEILALFLGEYRDSEGNVPENVKKYNRGVLNALNQNVPHGKLDNHQIRKLNSPKVVYRCFMEQCALDNTIDTQEWTDQIYEDLKDFELSDNSKNEIKELVKYEADIAGVEYFIIKYTKDNAGVIDTDFEIDLESSVDPIEKQRREAEALKEEVHKQIDLMKLNITISRFDMEFSSAITRGGLDFTDPFLSVDHLMDEEVKEEISSGDISIPFLVDSINRSLEVDTGFVHEFIINALDEDYKEIKLPFFIATSDGFFFYIKEKVAFVEYDAIRSVSQNSDAVTINSWSVRWFSKNGLEESGEDEIIIERNSNNKKILGALRRGIKKIIEETGGYVESSDDKVEEIIGKYINKIPNNSSAVPYMVKDFGVNDEKKKKKMKNALAKYALKVREDEVVAFIDTSVFGGGGSGILFSKNGLAFDYAFEKVFVKYEEIDSMEIKKGKELILFGSFSERKNDASDPSIPNIYFDLNILKECLEEIMYVL